MYSLDYSLIATLSLIGATLTFVMLGTGPKKPAPVVDSSTADVLRHQYIADRGRIEHAMNEIKQSLDELRVRMSGIETGTSEIPFPRWVISLEGRYLSVNSAFAQKFLQPIGKTAGDIIGKTHQQMWPATVATRLRELDKAAMESPAKHARADQFQFDPHVPNKGTIFKFAVTKGGIMVAMEGIFFDID